MSPRNPAWREAMTALDADALENLIIDRIATLASMREYDACWKWHEKLKRVFGCRMSDDYTEVVELDSTRAEPIEPPQEQKPDDGQGQLL